MCACARARVCVCVCDGMRRRSVFQREQAKKRGLHNGRVTASGRRWIHCFAGWINAGPSQGRSIASAYEEERR